MNGPPVSVAPSNYKMFCILGSVRQACFFNLKFFSIKFGEYTLHGMFVQDPEMSEDLNLPLSCQVLVSEEDDTALIG